MDKSKGERGRRPLDRPPRWVATVNRPMDQTAAERVELSLRRDTPLGTPQWMRQMALRLGLQSTMRPRGRPQRPLDTLSPRQRRRREGAGGTKVQVTPL